MQLGAINFHLIVIVLSSIIWNVDAGDASCKDDNGNSVDWFYASKLPWGTAAQEEESPQYNGLSYLYLLSSEPNTTSWTLSTKNLEDPDSMFGRTLSGFYQLPREQGFNYVAYNDEGPDGNTVSVRGHMKGVLVFDEQGRGFWMVHSVPKYPNVTAGGTYDYPDSGRVYGQSFMCVSLGDLTSVNAIGSQFLFAQPNVYDYHLEDWVRESATGLWDAVVYTEAVSSPPWSNIAEFKSRGGSTFTYFAKHVRYNKDLYADLVAPTLKTNLWVETWRHGRKKTPSVCGRYQVENVKAILIKTIGYSYKNTKDHSKWAVSANSTSASNNWFCSGDLNRMDTQFRRGGGTVCLSSPRVRAVYDASTKSTEPCSQTEWRASPRILQQFISQLTSAITSQVNQG